MATEVDIVNSALIKIGNENIISAIGQDGREGEMAEIIYPLARDKLLAAHPWNFAIGRQTLIADVTTPAFEYDKQYYLPADCLRALMLYDSPERWKVEDDQLLTDETAAKLIYIKKVTNTGKFSALFTEALSDEIAAQMSEVISGSTSRTSQLKQVAKASLKEAKTRDGQEGTPDNIQADAFTSFKNGQVWW